MLHRKCFHFRELNSALDAQLRWDRLTRTIKANLRKRKDGRWKLTIIQRAK